MRLGTISEKTGLSLGVLITLAGLAIGVTGSCSAAVASFAVSQNELGHVKVNDEKQDAAIKALAEGKVASDSRTQRLEDNYAQIVKSLGKIEEWIEKQGATQPARYSGGH
jgi:hypothetical protein